MPWQKLGFEWLQKNQQQDSTNNISILSRLRNIRKGGGWLFRSMKRVVLKGIKTEKTYLPFAVKSRLFFMDYDSIMGIVGAKYLLAPTTYYIRRKQYACDTYPLL